MADPLKLLEDNSASDNMLNKLGADADSALKSYEALTEDFEKIPEMAPSTSFTSKEKLKTQVFQMLHLKKGRKAKHLTP